jgi:pimeloyl-ACP methyl ester carboxylesterase
MEFLTKLRGRIRYYQIGMAAVALICFVLLAVALTSWMLLSKTLAPPASGGLLDPQSLLGRIIVVNFTAPDGEREGWFFPGLRGGPTIVLLHGYQSRKEELLTMTTALQEHQYNVFLFDLAGHGKSAGVTTLGFKEQDELLAAIQALAARDDVDRNRFGVWGQGLGGYVALATAQREPRIRALVVDSTYNTPQAFLRQQIEPSALNILSLSSLVCRSIFYFMNFGHRNDLPLDEQAAALRGVPKMFVVGNDDRVLAEATLNIFVKAAEPKSQSLSPRSRYAFLLEEEKRTYDNSVVQFFLQNLPPVALPAPD